MSEPYLMDRVGIDGLDGPGGKRRPPRGRSKVEGAAHDVDFDSRSQAENTLTGGQRVTPQEPDLGQVEKLKALGFSTGLSRALTANADVFERRIWVVDNSGSMQIGDGHRIVETADRKIVAQAVTRWEEIQETVVYHARIASLLNTPTVFKLLNDPGPQVGPQEFSVAKSGGDTDSEIRNVRTLMQRAKPLGVTPLTQHIWRIQESLHRLAPRLRRDGQRVALILATDGLPTDDEGYGGDEVTDEFIRALRSLEGLPIWLVIRLCTDEVKVTNFYNQLDGKLELSLEVIDDFLGEATEVYRHNKWLNYALPMHRCRELGYHDRLFDLIDERPLTKGELRDFCSLLFGADVNDCPDPNTEWKEFVTFIQYNLALEQLQWNPIKKKVTPWIDVRMLNKSYGQRKCTIM